MFDARTFDERYYRRFYHAERHHARAVAAAGRTADLIHGMARHYGVPVRRIVDLGAGTGNLLRARAKALPAREDGRGRIVELCSRPLWLDRVVLVDFEDAAGFDIVVCNDVIQYLDDESAELALERLAVLCRGMLYFTGLTAVDVRETGDPDASDLRGHFRAGDWYRERLAPGLRRRWFRRPSSRRGGRARLGTRTTLRPQALPDPERRMTAPTALDLPLHAHLPSASRLVFGCMGLGGG